jgi:hypothetical protein
MQSEKLNKGKELPCGDSGGLKSMRLAIWAIWAGRAEGPLSEHPRKSLRGWTLPTM